MLPRQVDGMHQSLRCCRLGSDQRANPLCIRRRCRIVDHHVEIRPAIDGKGRIFQRDRPGKRVPQGFGELAIRAADVIVAPYRFEFGAEPAEFIHQCFNVPRSPGSCCVRSERRDREPRDAFPIRLRGSDARIAEDEAQDIALLGRERSIVGQHRRGGAVPCDNVPC
jgi:hypothetical protein